MPTIINSCAFVHIILSPELSCPMKDMEARNTVFQSISVILKQSRNKPIIVNGDFDHVHILFELNPYISLGEIIEKLKTGTEQNAEISKLIKGFKWQEGYFAVSEGLSHVRKTKRYIKNQAEYHRLISFREEYINLLKENGIEFDPKGLFDFHQ